MAGLNELKSRLSPSGKFASYLIAGPNHQHTWRPRFYTAPTGGVTIANWTTSPSPDMDARPLVAARRLSAASKRVATASSGRAMPRRQSRS